MTSPLDPGGQDRPAIYSGGWNVTKPDDELTGILIALECADINPDEAHYKIIGWHAMQTDHLRGEIINNHDKIARLERQLTESNHELNHRRTEVMELEIKLSNERGRAEGAAAELELERRKRTTAAERKE